MIEVGGGIPLRAPRRRLVVAADKAYSDCPAYQTLTVEWWTAGPPTDRYNHPLTTIMMTLLFTCHKTPPVSQSVSQCK